MSRKDNSRTAEAQRAQSCAEEYTEIPDWQEASAAGLASSIRPTPTLSHQYAAEGAGMLPLPLPLPLAGEGWGEGVRVPHSLFVIGGGHRGTQRTTEEFLEILCATLRSLCVDRNTSTAGGEHPHPSPPPQAGEGAMRVPSPASGTGSNARPLSCERNREQCASPSPASRRGSNARPPLPLAGEGWGEGRGMARSCRLQKGGSLDTLSGWPSTGCTNANDSACSSKRPASACTAAGA